MYDTEGEEIDHEAEVSYTVSLSGTNSSLNSGYFYTFCIGYPTVRFDLSDYKHLVIGQFEYYGSPIKKQITIAENQSDSRILIRLVLELDHYRKLCY